MNRVASLLSLCALGIVLSCTQHPDPAENAAVRTVSFRATGENATRTSLHGNDVYWSEGDLAAVFSADGAAAFSASEVEGASCTFTGRMPESGGTVYALYPYSAEAACNQGVISAVLPPVQCPVAGGFDPSAALSVSAADRAGDAMSFKNVGALVRFSISEETARDLVAVVLKSTAGTPLSGRADISLASGVPAVTVTEGSDEVTLQGSFEAGEYCFVVLPGSHHGLSLTFKKATLTGRMTSSFNASFERSTSSQMGTLAPASWEASSEYEPLTLELNFSNGSAFVNPFEYPDLMRLSTSTGAPSFPGTRAEFTLPASQGGYTCAAFGSKGVSRSSGVLIIGQSMGDYFECPGIPGLCLNRITLVAGGAIAGASISTDEGKAVTGGALVCSASAKGETLSWTLYGAERGRAYRLQNAASAYLSLQSLRLEYAPAPNALPAGTVSPFDYGLREATTGEARYEAIYKAHCAAVALGLGLDYSGVGTVELTVPSTSKAIPLPPATDFKGTVFKVRNDAKKCFLFSMEKIFSRVAVSGAQIDAADYSAVPALAGGLHLLRIQDDRHWVDDREGFDHPADRADVVLVRDGVGSNGPVASYSTDVTRINAEYCDADDTQKSFCNVTLVRDAASRQIVNLLSVRGVNNLYLGNVRIETPSGTGIYDDTAIDIRHCTNVTCEDLTFDGLYCDTHETGYGLSINNTWNAVFRRIHSHNGWAAFGCNNMQDSTLEDSDVERFDIHCYGRNITVRNSTLTGKGIPCSSIFGTILCEHVTFSDCFTYSMRTEYNAFTPFDIVLKDCELIAGSQHALVNIGKVDAKINPRPELAKKHWPNLEVDGLTVRLIAGASTFSLFHLSDIQKYPDPLGHLSRIKVKGLKYVYKTSSPVRTYVVYWPITVENPCEVEFDSVDFLPEGVAGPARVTLNLNGNVTSKVVDSNISIY